MAPQKLGHCDLLYWSKFFKKYPQVDVSRIFKPAKPHGCLLCNRQELLFDMMHLF